MDGHQEIFASVSGVIGPFSVQILGVVLGVLQPGHRRRTTGTCKPWANLLIWGSVAALGVGVLNSIRLAFMPTTLWALATYIVMIAAGEAWQGGSPMGLKPAPSDHSATSHATICSCSLARSALVTNRANCGC